MVYNEGVAKGSLGDKINSSLINFVLKDGDRSLIITRGYYVIKYFLQDISYVSSKEIG